MKNLSKAMHGRNLRRVIAITAATGFTFGLAACGSDDSSDTADAPASTTAATATATVAVPKNETTPPAKTDSGYYYAGGAAATAEAKTAGEAAAGEKATLPTGKTIGVVQLSGQSATSIAITDAAKQIGKLLDYKVNVCDPNFDAQKVPQCANSIVAQNPDVVYSVSQNPGPMGSGFKDAVAKDIPWFGTGSASTPAPGLTDYGVDGFELASSIDKYMLDKMNAGTNDKKVFAITAPTVGQASINEGEQLTKDVKASTGATLVKHDLDLANAVQDTLNSTRQTLEQNPELGAVWTLCDFCLPLMAQQVAQKQKTDRTTTVAGLFSSPDSIDGIRKGSIDAVADNAWSLPVWVGMDQALAKMAGNKPIASGADVYKGYDLPFNKPYVITKENAGAAGAAPIFGPDYETFFKAKWAKEYGITAS
jgi:ABC-type sugar transport system substrate-binding protein